MKILMLNSPSSEADLTTYNPTLLNELKKSCKVIAYNQIENDFSNIPELFDQDEKLLMINHFAIENGFENFSKHLPKFKNIKYILSPYSSYAGLDLELLKQLGIKYRNNGGANANSVAQYALTCMYMLLCRFPQLAKLNDMPDGTILGEELNNKTVGIIGMGNIGQALLETLNKLKVKTTYYNRTPKKVSSNLVTIEKIFEQDIVFITIATNKETQQLLAKIPQYINPKNYLIDVSAHDELYDKQKVIDLLAEEKLKGFALETDLRYDKKLNLITTSHIAWCTYDAEKRTVDNYLNRALTIIKGKIKEIDFIV